MRKIPESPNSDGDNSTTDDSYLDSGVDQERDNDATDEFEEYVRESDDDNEEPEVESSDDEDAEGRIRKLNDDETFEENYEVNEINNNERPEPTVSQPEGPIDSIRNTINSLTNNRDNNPQRQAGIKTGIGEQTGSIGPVLLTLTGVLSVMGVAGLVWWKKKK